MARSMVNWFGWQVLKPDAAISPKFRKFRKLSACQQTVNQNRFFTYFCSLIKTLSHYYEYYGWSTVEPNTESC